MIDIKNAHEAVYTDVYGKRIYEPAFISDDEKERASEIVKQLKGMTIREAQDFLKRVSEALIGAYTL